MNSRGRQIDAAYAAFEKGKQSAADRHQLRRTQSRVQAEIEKLRREADSIMSEWWDVHRAVGAELAEAATELPAFLPALKRFNRLPLPGPSNPKLDVLQLIELVRNATTLVSPAEPTPIPVEPKAEREAAGLLTAKEISRALGISDKTVYRLARQGRIPYVRIQSSLRFRRKDIEAWLETKAFRPSTTRKGGSSR